MEEPRMDSVRRSEAHGSARPARDLDAEIAVAEQAVIARDLRIQRHAADLSTRLRGHWPLVLGVTLGVAFLLGRALSPAGHGRAALALRKAVGPDAPVWRLLPLLWPLLPRELRARVPSGTVALLSNIAATLTGGLRPGRKG